MTENAKAPAQPRRKNIRWGVLTPTIVLGVLVAVYAVYWWTVAGEIKTRIETAALDNGRIETKWKELGVYGFPYRFTSSFTAPEVAAPRTPEQWRWQADEFSASFLPYDFNHVIFDVEGEQRLSFRDVTQKSAPRRDWRIKADAAWSSYVAEKGTPFGRLAIDVKKLDAKRENGDDTLTADRLQLHTRPAPLTIEGGAAPLMPGTPKPATAIDLALQGDNMVLPARLTPPALGNTAKLVILQARLRNVPATRAASPVEFARDWMAAGGTLAVSDLKVKWGPLDMDASGEVTLDEQGRPAGRLDAQIADYEGLVSALVKAGRIPQKNEKMALAGLGLISQFQGNKSGRVRVPVVMSKGKLYLGPVPVARLDPVY
ncbi:DUF2125 domain-containing protein [Parvibaculum sp. MBR-TMA-1.3b-4.2]|jgi:hypothetical protein